MGVLDAHFLGSHVVLKHSRAMETNPGISRAGHRNLNLRILLHIFVHVLGVVGAEPQLAPGFLKFDISELPALFAGFFLGPVSGCLVIVVKVVLKLLLQGTDTAFVGEFMNILGSVCFILPASLIYKWNHTKKGAVISLTVSSILVSIAFIFINAYIAFPLYSELYGMPMETIVAMGTAVNPYITDVPTLMLFSVFPFNLFKHGVTSAVTYLVYKRVGNVLRGIIAPQVRIKTQSI